MRELTIEEVKKIAAINQKLIEKDPIVTEVKSKPVTIPNLTLAKTTEPSLTRTELLAKIKDITDTSSKLPIHFAQPQLKDNRLSHYNLMLKYYQAFINELRIISINIKKSESEIVTLITHIESELRKAAIKIKQYLIHADVSYGLSKLTAEIEAQSLDINEYIRALAYKAKHSIEFFKDTITYKEIIAWSKLEDADPDAQYHLGLCSLHGCGGVDKDLGKAVDLLRLAAHAGHGDAQGELSYCYEKGLGVLPSKHKTEKWHLKSIKNLYPSVEQQFQKALHLLNASLFVEDAASLLTKASHAGHIKAKYYLGFCCENGIGLKKSIRKAMACYKTAAALGDPMASFKLGVLHNEVFQNIKEAMKHFHRSAIAGHKEAQFMLGDWYEVHGNHAEAAEWYQRAANQNDARALNNLGRFYAKGIVFEQDMVKARKLFWLSAREGDKNGQFNLAEIYISDDNPYEAVKWHVAAMLQGEGRSKKRLNYLFLSYPELNLQELATSCQEVIRSKKKDTDLVLDSKTNRQQTHRSFDPSKFKTSIPLNFHTESRRKERLKHSRSLSIPQSLEMEQQSHQPEGELHITLKV